MSAFDSIRFFDSLYAIEETTKSIDINGEVTKDDTKQIEYAANKPYIFKNREDAKRYIDQFIAETIDSKLSTFNASLYKLDCLFNKDDNIIYKLHLSGKNEDEQTEYVVVTISTKQYHLHHFQRFSMDDCYNE